MIEFFEFLNTCSPLRAVSYMAFIIIVLFITYVMIDSIFGKIFGRNTPKDDEEYTGVADDDDAID